MYSSILKETRPLPNAMTTHVTFPTELPYDFCKGLLRVAQSLDKQEAEVTMEEDSVLVDEVRNSRISWLRNQEITDIMAFYAHKANQLAGWDYNISFVEVPQFSSYKKGNFYDWHYDTGGEDHEGQLFRKLTVTIALNDEYKGGDLQVQNWVHPQAPDRFTTVKDMRRTGTVCVFPSYVFHRITKVKQGERNSLTAWFRGCRFL